MGMRVYNRPKAIWINLAFKKLSWDPHQKSWLLSHWPEFTYLYKRGYEIHVLAGYIAVLKIIRVLLVRKKKNESEYWAGNQQIWPQPPYKESSCNAGDPGSITGSGRSAGEGIDYPLQSSWASLVAQLVKNLPTMRETRVRSLGWEDSLEKGKATHSSILAWRIPRIPWSVGSQRVGHHWVTFAFSYNCLFIWYMYIMLQFYG